MTRNVAMATALAAAVSLSHAAAAPAAVASSMRSEITDPQAKAAVAEVLAAFDAFKAANDERLKAKADVVIDEKVEKLNAEIGKLQSAVDDMNARNDAARIGAGAMPQTAEEKAYASNFADYFKRGDHTSELSAAHRHGGLKAALSEGSSADGGYTVPIEWDRTITGRLKLVSPIRSIAQVQTTSKRGWIKLLSDRSVGSGWVGETAARTQTSTPQLTPLQFAVGEIYANPAATQDILDDSEVDLAQWLADEVDTEFSRQEGIAFVSGNGTNKPYGLLSYTDNSVHPWGPIATKISGTAATIGATDALVDLVYDLPAAYAPDARFIMNRGTQGAIRKLKDGQGNYIWQPTFVAGQPATLMGYPITEVPDMPNIGAGAVPIMFGDFKRGYLVIDRMGVRVLRDPFTNKPYVMFYTTKRVGGGVQNPDVLRYYKCSAT